MAAKKKMTSDEIREAFLRFFEKKSHKIVPSSSLVPHLDPTLLFTNAGMNQFKSIFTGEEKRDYQRATSSQKCVRAGGKHNDLENVGRTARHHTFFEMLGNFSFGDYFKKEAIAYAWEFVTKDLSLPKDRLYVSVYKDDEEAFRIWRDEIGVSEDRIYRFGDKDNFWSMGETGPCGPCSEIFYDMGEKLGGPECEVGGDNDRYIEFWNLVFMEFEQKADGSRVKLPKPSIDTGMGLERMAAIVQGVPSNFDTDLFEPVFKDLGDRCKMDYKSVSEEEKVSMRVIADHVRAATFLITDGVHPSNEGRGYVLRRIMRRAMRHGRQLGLEKPFLFELAATLAKQMEKAYPELSEKLDATQMWIEKEEVAFAKTIDRGLSLLQDEIKKLKEKKSTTLNGEVAFRLYDTYGFPVDMTADILRDDGLFLDQSGFDEAFAQHREKARGSWKGSSTTALDDLAKTWISQGLKSDFLGYEQLTAKSKVIKLAQNGKEIEKAKSGDEVELLAEDTPFYGESGGQVGDVGGISGDGFSLEVLDTSKYSTQVIVHKCKVIEGEVQVGDKISLSVDSTARSATAKNHTATHLLHATLKEILGSHVQQKGSLVAPERLRFDFTHPKAVTAEEISRMEKIINERVWEDEQVAKQEKPLEEALASGAVALFDEKYGSNVRVISVSDYSMELCGGTHLDRTGEIGIFKIVKESSVSAGVRRIEAFTGHRALRYVQDVDHHLRQASSMLGTSVEKIEERIQSLLKKQKEKKKQKSADAVLKDLSTELPIRKIGEVNAIIGELQDADQRSLREIADRQLERVKNGVVVLGVKSNDKAFLVVKVSKDLTSSVNAKELVTSAAALLGGSGGGRPDMAQAGGTNPEKLSAALQAIEKKIQ